MELECDLLTTKFRDPKTVVLVREKIGGIFDGSLSHRAGTLKLGLEKAFEVKKQKVYSQLQCPNHSCARHGNPVSYSSIGSSTRCPNCRQFHMRCTACGHDRLGTYMSCKKCGKKFI